MENFPSLFYFFAYLSSIPLMRETLIKVSRDFDFDVYAQLPTLTLPLLFTSLLRVNSLHFCSTSEEKSFSDFLARGKVFPATLNIRLIAIVFPLRLRELRASFRRRLRRFRFGLFSTHNSEEANETYCTYRLRTTLARHTCTTTLTWRLQERNASFLNSKDAHCR